MPQSSAYLYMESGYRKRTREVLLSDAYDALQRCVASKDVSGFKQALSSRCLSEGIELTVDEVLSFVHKVDETTELGDTLLTGLSGSNDVSSLPMLLAVVEYLRTAGRLATIDTLQGSGMTALMLACLSGRTDVVKLLLEEGADVDKATADGWTPLIIACRNGHTDVVKVLVKEGADVDRATADGSEEELGGCTPLIIAIKVGKAEVVKVLLEGGADVDKPRADGCTPLIIAIKVGVEDIAKLLLEGGADVDKPRADGCTPLTIAIEMGQAEIVKLLKEGGVDVDKADNSGETMLHAACYYGHAEIVALLLKEVADVDKTNTAFRETPLHIATQEGHDGVVKLLLKSGTDVNRPDKYGKRPIYIACERGREQCLATLLEHSADFGLYSGRLPIAAAHREGFEGCVKILREWPALRNLRNQQAVKMCASRLKRQGTYEALQKMTLNELSKEMFVYIVLDEMMSRGMYGLAEQVVSCVGIGKAPEEDEDDEGEDAEGNDDDYEDDE